MKYYFDYLKKYFDVNYLDYKDIKKYNFTKKFNNITMFDPVDHLFLKRAKKIIVEKTRTKYY